MSTVMSGWAALSCRSAAFSSVISCSTVSTIAFPFLELLFLCASVPVRQPSNAGTPPAVYARRTAYHMPDTGSGSTRSRGGNLPASPGRRYGLAGDPRRRDDRQWSPRPSRASGPAGRRPGRVGRDGRPFPLGRFRRRCSAYRAPEPIEDKDKYQDAHSLLHTLHLAQDDVRLVIVLQLDSNYQILHPKTQDNISVKNIPLP